MRILYLDCGMGAAGDMLSAALLELHPDREAFLARFNSLGIPGVRVEAEPRVKRGITGTWMKVMVNGMEESDLLEEAEHHHDHEEHHHDHEEHHHDHEEHHHEHSHHSLADIEAIIGRLPISEKAREDSFAVYKLIAEAESAAHNRPVGEVHFHEVGTMDAVADVVCVCLLLEDLKPDVIMASPVHVGSGQVRCAHGILPVPAPATAFILKGVPIYGGSVIGELCTPTGAALLKRFVTRFGSVPVMSVEKIGYGMGHKDFEAVNCVRAFLGEGDPDEAAASNGRVTELSCNLDDMTPEAISFAMDRLFEAGALDVYTTPIGMKKSRPGVKFSCICESADERKMAEAILANTTTLGVRANECHRYTMERSFREIQTEYGPARMKEARGFGAEKAKPEIEDAIRLAKENGVPLSKALEAIYKVYRP